MAAVAAGIAGVLLAAATTFGLISVVNSQSAPTNPNQNTDASAIVYGSTN